MYTALVILAHLSGNQVFLITPINIAKKKQQSKMVPFIFILTKCKNNQHESVTIKLHYIFS